MTPAPAAKRVRLGWVLVWGAWGPFLMSLALPAVSVDMGAWNNPEVTYLPGYACAAMIPWFYPTNVLMLLGPLLYRLAHRPRLGGWPRWIVCGILFISVPAGLACLTMFRAVHFGYVFWICSMVLMGWAFCRRPVTVHP